MVWSAGAFAGSCFIWDGNQPSGQGPAWEICRQGPQMAGEMCEPYPGVAGEAGSCVYKKTEGKKGGEEEKTERKT